MQGPGGALQSLPFVSQDAESDKVMELTVLEDAVSLAAVFNETDLPVQSEAALVERKSRGRDSVQIQLLKPVVKNQSGGLSPVSFAPVALLTDGNAEIGPQRLW